MRDREKERGGSRPNVDSVQRTLMPMSKGERRIRDRKAKPHYAQVADSCQHQYATRYSVRRRESKAPDKAMPFVAMRTSSSLFPSYSYLFRSRFFFFAETPSPLFRGRLRRRRSRQRVRADRGGRQAHDLQNNGSGQSIQNLIISIISNCYHLNGGQC